MNNHKHIRITPYAVATVDENCSEETIKLLTKMAKVAHKQLGKTITLLEASKEYVTRARFQKEVEKNKKLLQDIYTMVSTDGSPKERLAIVDKYRKDLDADRQLHDALSEFAKTHPHKYPPIDRTKKELGMLKALKVKCGCDGCNNEARFRLVIKLRSDQNSEPSNMSMSVLCIEHAKQDDYKNICNDITDESWDAICQVHRNNNSPVPLREFSTPEIIQLESSTEIQN